MAIHSRSLALGFKRCLLPLLACGSMVTAHAAFIDFEDLPPIPGNEDLTGYPITDQYAHLGVTFTSGAYLIHWIPDAYALSDLDQRDLVFRFSGELPTHVSFELGTLRPTDVRWRGATGRGENIRLDGNGPGHVSFASQAGIALVKVTFPFYVKGPGLIGLDNLYFGAVPAVPEPAPLALAGVGLLTLLAASLRKCRRGGTAPRTSPGRNDKTLSAKAAGTGKSWRRIAAALLLGLGGASAHATLITFNELPPPSDPLEPASTPVSNEYASLGLVGGRTSCA